MFLLRFCLRGHRWVCIRLFPSRCVPRIGRDYVKNTRPINIYTHENTIAIDGMCIKLNVATRRQGGCVGITFSIRSTTQNETTVVLNALHYYRPHHHRHIHFVYMSHSTITNFDPSHPSPHALTRHSLYPRRRNAWWECFCFCFPLFSRAVVETSFSSSSASCYDSVKKFCFGRIVFCSRPRSACIVLAVGMCYLVAASLYPLEDSLGIHRQSPANSPTHALTAT